MIGLKSLIRFFKDKPMQTITDFMLKPSELKQSADVVPLKQNRG